MAKWQMPALLHIKHNSTNNKGCKKLEFTLLFPTPALPGSGQRVWSQPVI